MQESRLQIEFRHWPHLKENLPKVDRAPSSINNYSVLARQDSETNGFWIEDEEVQIIAFDDHASYTFMVGRDDRQIGVLKNYVFRLYDDGTYEQHLLTYFYEYDIEGNFLMDTENLIIQEINDDSLLNRTGCLPELVQVGSEMVCGFKNRCFGPGANGMHETGDGSCVCLTSDSCWPAGTMYCSMEPIYEWATCSVGQGEGGVDNENPNEGTNNQTGAGQNGSEGENTEEENKEDLPYKRDVIIKDIETCFNAVGIIGQPDDGIYIEAGLLAQLGLTNSQLSSINRFLNVENSCSSEAQEFVLLAIEAFADGGEVDFEEMYIQTETPDDNYSYNGQLQSIPSTIELDDGSFVNITFNSSTSDGLSSDQEVSTYLVDGLVYALNEANNNLTQENKITEVNIYCTTNGGHSPTSNHYNVLLWI